MIGNFSRGDLFAGIDEVKDTKKFHTLIAHGNTRIQRIVSTGQASPPGFWYDQDEDEFVLLVTGAAS